MQQIINSNNDVNGISNEKIILNNNENEFGYYLANNIEQNFLNVSPNSVKIETDQILISKSKAKKSGKVKRKKHGKALLSTLSEVELNYNGDHGDIDLINNEKINIANNLDETNKNDETKT